MQGIALTAGPGRACPYDAVARHLFGDFVGCPLVEQRIDVVQPLGCHAVVAVVHVDILAEVGLNAGDAHLQQRLQQLVLIPRGGLRVGEVNGSGVVKRREVGGGARRRTVGSGGRGLADVAVGHCFR